jgi:hypothetical protein
MHCSRAGEGDSSWRLKLPPPYYAQGGDRARPDRLPGRTGVQGAQRVWWPGRKYTEMSVRSVSFFSWGPKRAASSIVRRTSAADPPAPSGSWRMLLEPTFSNQVSSFAIYGESWRYQMSGVGIVADPRWSTAGPMMRNAAPRRALARAGWKAGSATTLSRITWEAADGLSML